MLENRQIIDRKNQTNNQTHKSAFTENSQKVVFLIDLIYYF